MNLEYTNRRVLVVGGSYGIGLATARQIACEGAKVAIASRSAANLAQGAEEISDASGEIPLQIIANATQAGAAEAMAAKIEESWSGLDALVCNVGGSIRAAFEDLSDEDWLGNYELNLLPTVRAIRAFLPLLERGQDAAIVMLGSASSKMPFEQQVASNAHKAGLLALNKTLSAEFAERGIRVNLVAPGRILTPLWVGRADQIADDEARTRDEVLADFSQDIPMGRFGSADEVARMVTWLASPVASYITGQAVNVDGGVARGLL